MATTSSAWMNLPSVLLGHKVQDSIKHSGNDSCASLQSVRTYEEIAWQGMHLYSNLAPCALSALQGFPSSSSRILHTPFLSLSREVRTVIARVKKTNNPLFPRIPETLMVAAAFAAPKALLCLFVARQVKRPGRVTYTCSLESTSLSLTLSTIDPAET